MNLSDLMTRIKVVATSALAWLTAIAAVLTVVAQQIKDVAGVPDWVTQFVTGALAVITVIIFQVRRVTPVPDELKGLLPPKGPAVDIPPPADRGQTTLHIVLIVLAIIALIIFIFAHIDVNSKSLGELLLR
jgi:uncharacterized integral membrane protein